MVRGFLLTLLLAVALPAFAQESQPESRLAPYLHASIAAGAVLHGADLASTEFLMGRHPDTFREANPLFRPLTEYPVGMAVAKMGTYVAASYVLVKLHRRHPKLTLVASIASNAAVAYAVHRNNTLVRRVRR